MSAPVEAGASRRKLGIIVELCDRLGAGRQSASASGHQKSQQAGQGGAANEHQPVASIETKNPAISSHARDHCFPLDHSNFRGLIGSR